MADVPALIVAAATSFASLIIAYAALRVSRHNGQRIETTQERVRRLETEALDWRHERAELVQRLEACEERERRRHWRASE